MKTNHKEKQIKSIYHQKSNSFCHSLKNGQEEFEIKTKVTAEFLEDVIITAFEGGVDYWCVLDNSTDVWDKYENNSLPWSQCLFELLYNKEEIILYDIENPKEQWTLTWDKLIQGVGMHGVLKLDDLDAIQADAIIQCALFGKVVFG